MSYIVSLLVSVLGFFSSSVLASAKVVGEHVVSA